MSDTAWFSGGLRGWHVLLGLVLFFGCVFLVNGVLVYYALTTFGGGDTSDPYRKGLHYNDTLAEAARDAERGWQGALHYEASAGKLSLSLRDRAGEPISGLHIAATLGRPATDREDRSARFQEFEPGSYAAELKLAPGQWIAQLQSDELSRGDTPSFRLKERLLVRETP